LFGKDCAEDPNADKHRRTPTTKVIAASVDALSLPFSFLSLGIEVISGFTAATHRERERNVTFIGGDQRDI
jgi:hypothetical protein